MKKSKTKIICAWVSLGLFAVYIAIHGNPPNPHSYVYPDRWAKAVVSETEVTSKELETPEKKNLELKVKKGTNIWVGFSGADIDKVKSYKAYINGKLKSETPDTKPILKKYTTYVRTYPTFVNTNIPELHLGTNTIGYEITSLKGKKTLDETILILTDK